MDLSGTYIKGSGSYEVKEIAPPVESGRLEGDMTTWAKDGDVSMTEKGFVAESTDGGAMFAYMISSPTLKRAYRFNFDTIEASVPLLAIRYVDSLDGVAIDDNGVALTVVGNHTVTLTKIYTVVDRFQFHMTTPGVGNRAVVDNVSIEEVPEGYPLLDKGDTYLECTSAGTVAIPSDVAYGEWGLDLYKGADGNLTYVNFISNLITAAGRNGYNFVLTSTEAAWLQKRTGGSGGDLITAAAAYVSINTWYRIRITRTLDGEFYVYIRGGSFGDNDWTLIVAATGSNPVTDNTYIESEYFMLDLDAGDRFANLTVKKKGGFVIDDPSVVSGEWIDGANSGVWDDGANSGVWSDNI